MSPDKLLSQVRSMLAQQHMLRPDVRLVVAVSGGPDSLCLLHLLVRLQAERGPALHVAHLDHAFRGEQSAAEAHFVEQTAQAWGVPVTIERRDVPALARASGQNRQAAARAARYAFLARVVHAVGANALAVAHQADDQAETVLLHMLRGAGPAGLRGMRAVVPWAEWQPEENDRLEPPEHSMEGAPFLIRPLLGTTRAEIGDYCAEQRLEPRHDPSNQAHYYTRNRIRADLLPLLTSYNPQIIAALGRTASVCADDYAYIQRQLDELWPTLTETRVGAVSFRAAQWEQVPAALQRYALRRAAALLVQSDELSYEQVETGRAAITRGAGYQHTLGQGLLLRVEHHGFLLIHDATYQPGAAADVFHTLPQISTGNSDLPLLVPGDTFISRYWYIVSSYSGSDTGADNLPTGVPWNWQVVLDSDRLDGPLLVRRRAAGDRFRPAGGAGSRRLQDFFVDHKIPRELRADWPILTTPGSIVWVMGLRADDRFQATDSTQQPLWVMLRKRKLPKTPPNEES